MKSFPAVTESRPTARKVLLVFLILPALAAAFAASAQSYVWKSVAIHGGGFVSGIITHPAAPGLIYARTDIGGAYRWNPADNSWIPLLDFAADANILGVESLAIDPSDTNRLYIAASRGSPAVLLVSTNQGATFTSYTPPFALNGNVDGRSNGERMTVDPNLDSVLFYGTRTSGLFKSVNFGATWTHVAGFPGATTANGAGTVFVQCIASSGSPGNPTPVIFAGVSQPWTNLFRSIDGGATWSAVDTGAPTNQLPHHIAEDGLGNLYVTFNDNCGPNNVTTGFVIKLDLATLTSINVTPVKNPGAQGGFAGVSVDRQHPATVVVSTLDRWWAPSPEAPWDQIYRSTNSGASWVETMPAVLPDSVSAPWSVARSPHWAGDVEIDPYNSDHVVFITGYGVIGTTNMTDADRGGVVNWAFLNDGLEETVPLGLISPPAGAYLMSGVGDQGGFMHFDLDTSPPPGNYFSTHRVTSYGLDFAEADPSIVVRLFSETPYGGYSLNGGVSWRDFTSTPPGTGSTPGNIAISADGARIVWMPQASGAVAYYSTNLGSTWTASTGGPTGSRVPISDRVNPDRFYIYTSSSGGRMYVSTNGGATFSAAAIISSGATPRAVFGHEGDLWLPRGGSGLARSTDAGGSFNAVPSVQQASFVSFGKPADGQSYPAVFISGRVTNVTGIFRSDDQGATWQRINDDQHQYGLGSIHTFCADPRVFGRVYFGTEGRGIVYGSIQPTISLVPPSITISPSGNEVEIDWPLDHVGWVLQAQTNSSGPGANWTAVPNSTTTNRWFMPVDPNNPGVFFRLISP